MAQLTAQQRQDVLDILMREFSSLHTAIPATKAQALALVDSIDAALETAEVTIFQGLPAGPGKTWLQANQPIGRRFIEEVERMRKVVL